MRLTYFIFLLCCLLFASCAPNDFTEHQYGFFSGIKHGFCFPFAVFGKIIGRHVGLWAANNTGLYYWIGYILGLFWIGVPQWVRKRL